MSTPLTVGMEAKLDQLSKDFDAAGDLADKAVSAIEQKFKDANPSLGGITSALAAVVGGAAVFKLVDLLIEANKEMAQLADNATRVGLSTDRFQELAYAARLGGVSAKDFAKGVEDVATKLNDARREENDLTKLLEANNLEWKDRKGHVIGVNDALSIAARLIQNAATELDKIKIAEMLGLSKDWIKALEQGPARFNAIASSAGAAGGVIGKDVIDKNVEFTEKWREASVKWETRFKEAIINLTPLFDDFIAKASGMIAQIKKDWDASFSGDKPFVELVPGSVADRVATGIKGVLQQLHDDAMAVPPVLEAVAARTDEVKTKVEAATPVVSVFTAATLALGTAALGTAENLDKEIAALLKLAAAPVGPKTVLPKGDDDDDAKTTFDSTEDRLKRRIALFDAETASVGLNTQAKERARAIAELMAAAERADLTMTDELRKKIDALGVAYGEAANRAALAKQKFDGINSALTFAGDQAISILDGLRTKSLTAAQAVAQLSNQLITAIEKAVLLGQGPLASILGFAAAPGAGSVGGIFGALFGGGRAGGGDVEAGKSYLVGEAGPEIVRFGSNGTVLPNNVINSSGGSSQHNSFIVNMEAPSGGGDPSAAETMARAMRRQFEDMIDSRIIRQMQTGGLHAQI